MPASGVTRVCPGGPEPVPRSWAVDDAGRRGREDAVDLQAAVGDAGERRVVLDLVAQVEQPVGGAPGREDRARRPVGRSALHAQAVGGAWRELLGRVCVQRGRRRVPDDAVDAGAAAVLALQGDAPRRGGGVHRPAEPHRDARVEVEAVELVQPLEQAAGDRRPAVLRRQRHPPAGALTGVGDGEGVRREQRDHAGLAGRCALGRGGEGRAGRPGQGGGEGQGAGCAGSPSSGLRAQQHGRLHRGWEHASDVVVARVTTVGTRTDTRGPGPGPGHGAGGTGPAGPSSVVRLRRGTARRCARARRPRTSARRRPAASARCRRRCAPSWSRRPRCWRRRHRPPPPPR